MESLEDLAEAIGNLALDAGTNSPLSGNILHPGVYDPLAVEEYRSALAYLELARSAAMRGEYHQRRAMGSSPARHLR